MPPQKPASDHNQRGFLSLEIPLTREEDTGNYMCEVRNSQGKIFSSCYLQCEPTLEITNEVPTKPIFVKPMKRLTVDMGELIRFRVTVKGYPAPGFKWFKDGLEMHDSERITTEMMPNGVAQLVIERATVRDIGLYTCEAHNLAGRARSMVKVSVRDKFEAESWNARSVGGAEVKTEGKYDIPVDTITNTNSPTINFIPRQHNEEFTYKPIFTHLLPHNLTIRNKGRFILECCCNSTPRPKVTRFKDDKRIVEGPRYNLLSLGDWFGLEIVQGEITDSGIYTVKIKNEKGEVTSSCEVEMKLPTEKPRTVNMPIVTAYDVSKRSDRQVAVQSDEEGLFDYAEVVPSCRLLTRFKDDKRIVEGPRYNLLSLGDWFGLEIVQGEITDSGIYTVKIKNEKGEVTSSCEVEMKLPTEKPRTVNMPIVTAYDVSKRSDRQVAVQSDEEGLFDYAEVVPSCRLLTRFKDDKRIVEGPRYNLLSLGDWFGLEIVQGEITDSGIYTVKIKNEKGEVTSSCEVEMKLPTEKPRTVNMPIVTAYDVSKRSDRQVAVQSDEEGLFDYAEVVPSCRLCNTEHDWTALIEREVEVMEAEESPSFPDVLPDKITPPQNAENVTLTCKVQGNPIPRVVWFKDGKVLDSPAINTSLDMEARTAVLVIKKLTENETGKYTCVAYSENGGHATTTTEVQFRDTKATASSSDAVDAGKMSLPEFKVKLEDRNAAVGSQLKLEVITDGCPKPQVQWFKNGQHIEPNLEKYSIQNSEEGGHALVITSFHVSDADCYKCVAVNECGMVSTSAHVCVHEKCTINSSGETERPTFKEPLHSLVSKQGDDVVFKCVANGNPKPTLTWLRDTTPLTSGDRVVIFNTDRESSLTIKNVSINDAGLYICVAENEEGKVESCSSLQVIGGSVSKEAIGSLATDATDASSQGGKGNPGETVDAAGSITNQQDALVDSTLNGGAAEPAIDINDFDFLKRPKFIARPLTQWVVADDELYLSVEVVQAENTVVNWYHNGKKYKKAVLDLKSKKKPCERVCICVDLL